MVESRQSWVWPYSRKQRGSQRRGEKMQSEQMSISARRQYQQPRTSLSSQREAASVLFFAKMKDWVASTYQRYRTYRQSNVPMSALLLSAGHLSGLDAWKPIPQSPTLTLRLNPDPTLTLRLDPEPQPKNSPSSAKDSGCVITGDMCRSRPFCKQKAACRSLWPFVSDEKALGRIVQAFRRDFNGAARVFELMLEVLS